MHNYMVDKNLRGKFIIGIFSCSIILSTVLTMLLNTPINLILTWMKPYNWINEVLKICDALGITTNFIGIPFLYAILYYAFDKKMWKWKFIRKIYGIPDLNGKWEGKLNSSYSDVDIKMNLEVEQTWSQISFVSTYPKSRSESNTASFFLASGGIMKVGFGFINHSRELPHQYDGYNILDIDDDTHLFGRYFNNRDNSSTGREAGNVGTFKLTKIS